VEGWAHRNVQYSGQRALGTEAERLIPRGASVDLIGFGQLLHC
jgi:hypothetical protein